MVFEGLTYGETIKNSRRKIFKVTQLIFEMKNYSKLQILGKNPQVHLIIVREWPKINPLPNSNFRKS